MTAAPATGLALQAVQTAVDVAAGAVGRLQCVPTTSRFATPRVGQVATDVAVVAVSVAFSLTVIVDSA